MLVAHFHEVFQEKYQRNNKQTKQKNLRCFPSCGESHVKSGFCGRPINVTCTGVILPGPGYRLRAFGEIVELSTEHRMVPGQIITEQDAQNLERTRAKPLNPWLRGVILVDPSQPGTVHIEFNKNLIGWHYDWKSSKHISDSFHAFKANLFWQPPYSNLLLYYGSAYSPHFQVHSRRRNRGPNEESPVTSPRHSQLKRKASSDLATSSQSSSTLPPAVASSSSSSSLPSSSSTSSLKPVAVLSSPDTTKGTVPQADKDRLLQDVQGKQKKRKTTDSKEEEEEGSLKDDQENVQTNQDRN